MLPTTRRENSMSEVPKTMEELLELPGVARKTANIVLYNAYGSNRRHRSGYPCPQALAEAWVNREEGPEQNRTRPHGITPKEKWMPLTDLLIFHGRQVCTAKKPKCAGLRTQPDLPLRLHFRVSIKHLCEPQLLFLGRTNVMANKLKLEIRHQTLLYPT